ncbi:MAG: radical SAM protein [Patescibacteria group bacterium]|nr:radical SAM protein [Patescibacteria group bacterium]
MANSKLDQLIDALLELKKGNKRFFLKSIRDYYPRCLSIYINSACNLRCLHCDCPREKYSLDNPELSAEEWEEIIRKFAARKGELIAIIGREPLLTADSRKKVYTVIMTAKKYGLKCGLVNNGSFFQKFIEEYPNAKMDYIDFSIEGLKEAHEKIRRGSDFKTIESAIKLAVKSKVAEDIYLATTLTNLNYQKIEKFFNHFRKIGKFKYVFHTLVPTSSHKRDDDRQNDRLKVSSEIYIKEILPALEKMSKHASILLDIYPVSFKNFSEFVSKILGDLIYINEEFVFAEKDDFSLRFTSILNTLVSALIVSPDGKVISMDDLPRKNCSENNMGNMLDALEIKQHPNFKEIKRKVNQINKNCFNKICFLPCLGQKTDCNFLKRLERK